MYKKCMEIVSKPRLWRRPPGLRRSAPARDYGAERRWVIRRYGPRAITVRNDLSEGGGQGRDYGAERSGRGVSNGTITVRNGTGETPVSVSRQDGGSPYGRNGRDARFPVGRPSLTQNES